jgi:hypothetical protein
MYPSPLGGLVSGGRKPTSGLAGVSSVVGSSDVNVIVSRPVRRFRLASMSTYTPSVAVASTRVLYYVRPGGTLTT